jgi:hypothetical protein
VIASARFSAARPIRPAVTCPGRKKDDLARQVMHRRLTTELHAALSDNHEQMLAYGQASAELTRPAATHTIKSRELAAMGFAV